MLDNSEQPRHQPTEKKLRPTINCAVDINRFANQENNFTLDFQTSRFDVRKCTATPQFVVERNEQLVQESGIAMNFFSMFDSKRVGSMVERGS
jgi:hypothetical protein